jgi:hypothetical protein
LRMGLGSVGRLRGRLSSAAFGAAIGRGAEIVAAVRAEAGAIPAARAEDGTEADRREHREDQGEEPMRKPDDPKSIGRRAINKVADAEAEG